VCKACLEWLNLHNGGPYAIPGTPIAVNGERRREWRAAPEHGEHNAAALKTILGLSDMEIESLAAAGALVCGA